MHRKKPFKGYFIVLIKEDFKIINEKFYENFIKSMSKYKFKKYVRARINDAAFKFLLSKKERLRKIKNIKYKKSKLQKYIKSNHFLAN